MDKSALQSQQDDCSATKELKDLSLEDDDWLCITQQLPRARSRTDSNLRRQRQLQQVLNNEVFFGLCDSGLLAL